MPIYSTKFALIIPLCLILAFSILAKELPTSALEFQQTTNTRIVVGENYLRFFTGSNERMTIDGSGNIGIGTTSPESTFHIQKGNHGIKSSTADLIVEDEDAHLDLISSKTASWGSSINLIEGDGAANTDIWSIARQTTGGSGNSSLRINFGTNNNQASNSNRLTINPNGNLGISSTSPPSLLSLGNHSGKTLSNTGITLGLGHSSMELLHSGSANGYGSKIYGVVDGNGVTSMRIAVRGNSTSWTDALYIKAATSGVGGTGDIGIGTTNPDGYKLNVNGNLRTTTYADIGLKRPTGARPEGLFVKSEDGNGYASIQLATKGWSGSHAILFNAYKSSSQVNGGLSTLGNTKFVHNAGTYSNGAGSVHFDANSGVIKFFISGISSGAQTDIDWGTPKMRMQRDGTIGINTNDPNETYKLHVNGKVYASSYHTSANTYADFVFEDNYRLAPLSEVEQYIEENNHLPDIPSEAEAKANGVDLQDMQAKLLQKIEELTLYVIEQNKKIESQSHLLMMQQKEMEKMQIVISQEIK